MDDEKMCMIEEKPVGPQSNLENAELITEKQINKDSPNVDEKKEFLDESPKHDSKFKGGRKMEDIKKAAG